MKIGITTGCFDLLHAGHILYLKEAKENCDKLITCLQTDPTVDRPDTKSFPVQSMDERRIQLAAIRYVDGVIEYTTEEELYGILKSVDYSVRFLGDDYQGRDSWTGSDLDPSVYFVSRDHGWSTTELKERVRKSF